jgi:hypothetical protein
MFPAPGEHRVTPPILFPSGFRCHTGRLCERCDVAITLNTTPEALLSTVDTDDGRGDWGELCVHTHNKVNIVRAYKILCH